VKGEVYGVLFGFSAGIMVYLGFKELLPAAMRIDPTDKQTILWLFVGIFIMAATLVTLRILGGHDHGDEHDEHGDEHDDHEHRGRSLLSTVATMVATVTTRN
jgi:hypothetical protein